MEMPQVIDWSREALRMALLLGGPLLAVAALRDNDTEQACGLLRGLSGQYPRNPLYVRELHRCH